jgi:hypothetical protein
MEKNQLKERRGAYEAPCLPVHGGIFAIPKAARNQNVDTLKARVKTELAPI